MIVDLAEKMRDITWPMVAAGIIVGACLFGCAPRERRVMSLLDQIPEGQPAGHWRIAALIPKRNTLLFHLDTYKAVNLMPQEEKLFQTRALSSFVLPGEIRTGEKLVTAVSYWRRWGEGGALSVKLVGHGSSQKVRVPLGEQAVIAELDAAERDSRSVRIVHQLEGPAEIPLKSIIAIAVEPGAEEREIDRALTLLRLWMTYPRNITDAVLRAHRIPFSLNGLTRESVMLLPGDTLSFDVSGHADDAQVCFWPQRLLEKSRLWLDVRVSGRWQRLDSWEPAEIPCDSWTQLSAELPLPRNSESIRFIIPRLASHQVAVSIGEPVLRETVSARKRKPNLIVIDFDTMRADRLGCYGYTTRPTSVTFDSIIEEKGFFMFTNAYSPSKWTLPATARFLTSRYLSVQDGAANGFPRDYTTLAELLRKNGYYCVAFTGGGMLRMPGFEQGFHEYYWSDKTGKVEESLQRGAPWLEGQPILPFFLFIHTFETHWPLIRDTFCKDLPRGRLGDLSRGEPLLPPGITRATRLAKEESLYVEAAYDGSVHAACEALVDLFLVMDELELWENAVVVVLSDHGEEFWDHFDIFADHHHSSLYGELINVPFLIYSPGLSGTPLMEEVSTIDLVPTLIELMGVDAPSQWDGISLAPLMHRGQVDRRIPILSLTTSAGAQQPRVCVIENGVKYIEPIGSPVEGARRSEGHIYPPKRNELFFLKDDPFERHNRVEEDPEIADAMSTLLRQGLAGIIGSDVEGSQSSQGRIPSDLENQLRVLGYLEDD